MAIFSIKNTVVKPINNGLPIEEVGSKERKIDSTDFTPEQARIAATLSIHFYNIYQPQLDGLTNILQGMMIFQEKMAKEVNHGDERIITAIRKRDLSMLIKALLVGLAVGIAFGIGIGLWVINR